MIAARSKVFAQWTGDMTISALTSLPDLAGIAEELSHVQRGVASEGIDDGVDRPNIVLIVTDDMRDSDWQALPKTQTLINDQGTVFPNFFLTTPVCSPSRSSILTGLYAHNHGVTRNSGKNGGTAQFKQRNLAERSIPNVLKAVGYRNGLFGKFMNGMSEKGGIPGAWDRWLASSEQAYYGPVMNDNGKARNFRKNQYSTDLIVGRAVEFIRETAAETPLFVMLTPKAPHGPSTPTRRDRGTFAGVQRERSPDVNEEDVSDKPGYIRNSNGVGLDSLDELERKRLESLIAVDDGIERIVGMLDEQGRLENTFIFVLSDNGFTMGSHRLMQKGVPYRESARVRMAVRGPGIAAGAIDERVAANIDLAPTIATLAGASLTGSDGVSLVESFAREAILLQGYAGQAFQAVRTARYLYVENEGGATELYDYETDPYELDNLLPGAEAIAAPLAVELARLRQCSGASCS